MYNLLVDKSLVYLSNLHIFFVRFHFKDRLKSKCKNSKKALQRNFVLTDNQTEQNLKKKRGL